MKVQKTIGKIVAVFFLVAMLFCIAGFAMTQTAKAEGISTINVEEKRTTPGKDISVEIQLSNSPNVAVLFFDLKYDDSVLTLNSITYGEEFSTGGEQPQTYHSPVRISWSDLTEKSGTLPFAVLHFSVTNSINAEYNAKIEIVETSLDAINIDEQEVEYTIVNGGITIMMGVPGDITGDGKVNAMDLLRLRKHFAGWEVEVDEIALDVTGDGKVNAMDLLRLRKYFAGWEVEIFYGTTSNLKCAHLMEKTEAKEATCLEDGNIEYWYCSRCKKYFSDVNGNTEISLEDTILTNGNHIYATEWSFDETHHWHAAICGHDGVIIEKEKHDWDSGIITKDATEQETGEKTYTCTVCSKTKIEQIPLLEHIHDDNCYSESWTSDDDYHWKEMPCTKGEGSINRTMGSHVWNENHSCNVCGFVEKCNVKFVDFDGSSIFEEKIVWGTSFEEIVKPQNPIRNGYIFSNWGETPKKIEEDIVLTAHYTEINPKITFRFIGTDNTEKEVSHTVKYGLMPTPPNADEIAEYKFDWESKKAIAFKGWNSELTPATENKAYGAIYEGEYERPIVAVVISDDTEGQNCVNADIVLCNLKKGNRRLYMFNFEMDYKAEGGTYSFSTIKYNEAGKWFNDNNCTYEYNDKDNFKTLSYAWSTPNLSEESYGTVIKYDYDDIITVKFTTQGPVNHKYIKIVPDSFTLVISDDGGETMNVVQPIILYKYNYRRSS